jgi:hypothetical protein
MSKSDFLENKLLDHMLGKTAYTMPTVYVGLYTAAPTDAGGGTEVSGAAAVTFPTASASWGTVTHFGLFDAASAGNMLRWGALTTSKTVGNGDTPSFGIGTLVLTED